MKYLFFVLILSFFTSCDKKDPNPELSDEVYKDYIQELDISTKALDAEEKGFEKILDEKKKVVPQTGQIKYVQKKVFDSERRIDALRQQKQFFAIKLELRKAQVQQRYLENLQGGRKWPDEEELKTYRSTIKFQRDKLTWDKNKGIKKSVPRGTVKPNESEPTEASEPTSR
ncbi:MAG: hypothetical protein H7328_10140 [Bdellovibrio sp.]|nr:hypothetical protein [Bdellovibrio sp.]